MDSININSLSDALNVVRKKVVRKRTVTKSGDVSKYADIIQKFLTKSKNQYSETRLVEELFNISLQKEGYIPKSTELDKLKSIREALRLLMDEKKIVGMMLEDPTTHENVLHYSTSGWYATP